MRDLKSIPVCAAMCVMASCGVSEGAAPDQTAKLSDGGTDSKFTVVLKGGPAFDQSANNFRVREATADFYWVVSDDYTIRIDARFRDGDGQVMATDLGNRNTMITYTDPEHGEILCGKDWSEEVVGDLQRSSLTAERVEATFRIELDKCSQIMTDEIVVDKMVILSGGFSLPRTDQ